jgi:hypothetical protein
LFPLGPSGWEKKMPKWELLEIVLLVVLLVVHMMRYCRGHAGVHNQCFGVRT